MFCQPIAPRGRWARRAQERLTSLASIKREDSAGLEQIRNAEIDVRKSGRDIATFATDLVERERGTGEEDLVLPPCPALSADLSTALHGGDELHADPPYCWPHRPLQLAGDEKAP
jgi:hypothetical protein